jgi:phosphoketolase
MIYVTGPGHGGPGLVANAWLEGTYAEVYPNVAQDEEGMGKFLRDVLKLNHDARNFRLFSPDENNSNRWQDVLEVTNRAWVADTLPWDDHLAPDGRVMEMLSEHQCQGWLEGYLLTGRHGFFSCYEAFIHIVDSMFNQHAKWLKVCNEIPWRRPIASLNYLLSLRRRANPGDPGRRRAPSRARARAQGPRHQPREPDEAATRERASARLSDDDFDALFTTDKPVIFAFHGYPWLIHRLTYRRHGHGNFHVRGYKEEGTTSTPFDMCVMNDLDRFHLVGAVIDRVPKLGARAAYAKQAIRDKLVEHKEYISRYGDDMPEIAGWRWGASAASAEPSSTEADNV